VRILRGDDKGRPGMRSLHSEGCSSESFGALAFHSKTAIEHMLDRLESSGFLRERQLDHGGFVLDLTSTGAAALQHPADLDRLLDSRDKSPSRKPAKDSETEPEVDEALFQALRTWRLERARAQSIPAFAVFHDSHLRAIAARKPTTVEDLAKLKGVGSRKLARYGAEVVELVLRHQR
jgi:superfamily II DNA helicase RecQ